MEPLFKQAKEILWASNRMQSFGPSKWIRSVNNTELRITFNNGSFIKLEGSENTEALRGLKPRGLIIWDEFKDIRKASIDAMDPNRARYDAPALYLGTPPEFHNHYVDKMEYLQSNPECFFTTATSFDNPYNSRKWLENKKAELLANGLEDIWLREYMAIFVKGGKSAIFPQIYKMKHPIFEKPKDLHQWTLVISFDPASTSVFAVSFALFNYYNRQVIIFDELYETEPSEMTARKIYAKVEEKISAYRGNVKDIRWIYDEAAAWFAGEIYDIPNNNWSLEKSQKHLVGIEGYIAITRTAFNAGLITITENCKETIKEYQGYIKDEKGKIPKERDHLINAISYKLQALGFHPDSINIPNPEDPFLSRRFMRIEDEIQPNNNLLDFDHDSDQNYSLEDL